MKVPEKYAIFQDNLEPINRNFLTEAFQSFPEAHLVKFDFDKIFQGGFGILAENLAPELANDLCTHLTEQGIPSHMATMQFLNVSEPSPASRGKCQESGLNYCDMFGGFFDVLYSEIAVIGAATIESTKEIFLDVICGDPHLRLRFQPNKNDGVQNFRPLMKDIIKNSKRALLIPGTAEFANGGDFILQFNSEASLARHLSWYRWKHTS